MNIYQSTKSKITFIYTLYIHIIHTIRKKAKQTSQSNICLKDTECNTKCACADIYVGSPCEDIRIYLI